MFSRSDGQHARRLPMAHSRRGGISYFVPMRSALETRENGTGCGIEANEL